MKKNKDPVHCAVIVQFLTSEMRYVRRKFTFCTIRQALDVAFVFAKIYNWFLIGYYVKD